MLKLEKIARTRDINVCIRHKPSFFSRNFFVALGCATAVHLSGIFLFHISPFKLNYKESLFLPTFVATDLMPEEMLDTCSLTLESQEKVPWYMLPPETALPNMQALVDHHLPAPAGLWKEYVNTALVFEAMSKEIKLQALPAFADPLPESSVSIHISGPLAASLLVQRHINEDQLIALIGSVKDLTLARRFMFKVQVDAHTGEIFWWDLAKKVGESDFQDYAIAILDSLRFQLPTQTFIQQGEIEIAFNLCMLQM